MKISQESVILIKKSLYVKAVWCTKAVECWIIEWIAGQGLETWKHRQSAEEYPPDGYTIVRQQAAVDRGHCVQQWKTSCSVRRTSQKASISSWDFAWNSHSLFKCAQDNSPWSPAHLLQQTSCSAVAWMPIASPVQTTLSSHSSAINLVIFLL